MAALKAAGITDAPVVLRFYKGEQRQPQDLVKLYPEDFGQGRNNRKMQFAFNAIPISYDYADKLPGLMSEYGSVQINYKPDDTQARTDEAVSKIINSSREEGDKVISEAAEPGARFLGVADHTPNSKVGHFEDFSSQHGPGIHIVFADGSTRMISDTIDLGIYQAITTRQGSEIVSGLE
jgi:hypothetical protein